MDGIITFITITLLIIIVPGPDFLIVMKNTIHSGKLNGSMAALGITSAHIIYTSLAVLGIIYILTSLYYVFLIIKILGACYLIYLGVQSIRSARQSMNFNTGGIKVNDVSCFTSYRQGFLSTILNPKALLYYVSVLPQFLSTGGIEVKSQVAILSLAVIMVILIWFLFCVFVFQYIKLLFSQPKVKAIFDYTVGFILIGLSINLLLSKSS
ncbi:LysE family translocator [Staphylococcus haemolyticus]|uniref:LysE family translocator n=2 Tax=Staphylococcus haemolyticus TaxID=1283 RepID=A0AB38PGV6_STAHA|nr:MULTISPECIES: LysE family translocator [Staphylococcus]MCE4963904.1 LysE family translocator [Staphylococcus haemolyticus]MCE4987992.1 LysE family translocator [Staphylococcus haemolyticus]MCE4992228.1 LysE family translocator [Staphylococcus haemolyticus]MCE5036543.1 LysE family translocator [Staphylococcus haemolyticus]MCE5050726.1 LysE family translocator [Staphylococcus haemolyticus]